MTWAKVLKVTLVIQVRSKLWLRMFWVGLVQRLFKNKVSESMTHGNSFSYFKEGGDN